MRMLRMRHLALLAVTVAVAACGGSSHKSTPSTGSSGATGTSGITSTPGSTTGAQGLSPSSPINSSGYRQLLATALSRIPGLPKGDITKVVNCAIQKLESQGLKTIGAVSQHHSAAMADGAACAKQLGLS